MKLRSLVLLAALIIPTTSALIMPEAEARALGNRASNRGELVAQRGNLTPEQRQAKRAELAEKMKAELGLSDAQVQQIQAIRAKYRPQQEALQAEAKRLRDGGATREQIQATLGARRTALRNQIKTEVNAILTPEQIKKMEELKTQRQERRQERRAQGRQ